MCARLTLEMNSVVLTDHLTLIVVSSDLRGHPGAGAQAVHPTTCVRDG